MGLPKLTSQLLSLLENTTPQLVLAGGGTESAAGVIAMEAVGLSGLSAALAAVGNLGDIIEHVQQFKEDLKEAESKEEYSDNGTTILNNRGEPYPEVLDPRTGKNMEFPSEVGERIPPEDRVGWYRNQSEANLYRTNDTDILCKKDFIDEWYRRGYETPEGGWDLYEIHHIKPREFGGSADFENMIPVLKDVHRTIITPWWNNYG